MNKQQFISGSITKRISEIQPQNPRFASSNKQQIFSSHLSRLNRSHDEIGKQSAITLSSFYQKTFSQYTKNSSLIDRIVETFDNGNIADLFHVSHQFAQSDVFLHFHTKNRQNIKQIGELFFKNPKTKSYSYTEPLTCQNYSKILVLLKEQPLQFQQVQEIKINYQVSDHPKAVIARSETVTTPNSLETKVDLLLNQIYFEKKRNDCPLYFQAMEIKLNEFIDYVIGDDDKYIGLSLKDKSHELIKELNTFKGKIMDGWLMLVLIEIFFQEFKELQASKAQALRMQRKSEQSKHQINSEMDLKSQKSNNSSIKKGNYSEPNSHRNHIKQDQWIGALK